MTFFERIQAFIQVQKLAFLVLFTSGELFVESWSAEEDN